MRGIKAVWLSVSLALVLLYTHSYRTREPGPPQEPTWSQARRGGARTAPCYHRLCCCSIPIADHSRSYASSRKSPPAGSVSRRKPALVEPRNLVARVHLGRQVQLLVLLVDVVLLQELGALDLVRRQELQIFLCTRVRQQAIPARPRRAGSGPPWYGSDSPRN